MRRNSSSNSNRRVRSTIRDVYGFEVPEKLAALYSKQNRTRSAEEKFRTEKWLQFLKDISPSNQEQKNVLSAGFFDEQMGRNLEQVIISHKTGAGTELGARLDILVRKGIPSFLRGHIWSLFLGYDIERDPGLFAFLSTQTKRPVARTPAHETSIEKPLLKSFSSTVFSPKQMESLDDPVLTDSDSIDSEEKTVDQIDKDLNRTFPGHPVMDEDGVSVLREILVAFSLHRPDIGYCQGMNFISGLLLLFNKPEDAFWNLVAIIERLLPNQFDSDMLPAVVDKLVFKHLVQMQFPKLAAHLDELAVDVSFLCPHWFLCCFVNALPTESCLRVWDILFWERNPSFLFKVGLALVDYHAENLKKATNSAMAWELLQNMARSAFNSSLLIQTALEKFPEINEEHITNLRTSYQSRVKQQQSIKDLIGRGVGFTLDDIGDENNSPTKILAASGGCLLRHASTDSFPSTGSAFFSDGHQSSSESSSGFGLNSSSRLLQELLGPLQDRKELLPEGIGSKVHELIDRLKEMEIENRQLKMKLGEAIVEEKRINETNQALKLRLGAAYTELDKKTECLDSIIAKAQTLTEKVASQEEIICKQRRMLCNRDNMIVDSDGLTKTSNRSSRSLKSLLFSGK